MVPCRCAASQIRYTLDDDSHQDLSQCLHQKMNRVPILKGNAHSFAACGWIAVAVEQAVGNLLDLRDREALQYVDGGGLNQRTDGASDVRTRSACKRSGGDPCDAG